MTISGLTPKNSGRQRTKSAILLGSTEPTACEQPVSKAGLMVYLARYCLTLSLSLALAEAAGLSLAAVCHVLRIRLALFG